MDNINHIQTPKVCLQYLYTFFNTYDLFRLCFTNEVLCHIVEEINICSEALIRPTNTSQYSLHYKDVYMIESLKKVKTTILDTNEQRKLCTFVYSISWMLISQHISDNRALVSLGLSKQRRRSDKRGKTYGRRE